jgi:hypothetical protein
MKLPLLIQAVLWFFGGQSAEKPRVVEVEIHEKGSKDAIPDLPEFTDEHGNPLDRVWIEQPIPLPPPMPVPPVITPRVVTEVNPPTGQSPSSL